jgi:type IV pilus assembly protein PilX
MERRRLSLRAAARPCGQRGVSMIFALLTLVAMSLASVALLRSVNTSAQIAGNLSFMQDATANTDRVIQEAIQILYAKLSVDAYSLNENIPQAGYYASTPVKLDPTGNARTGDAARALIKWDDEYCATYPSSDRASCSHVPVASAADLTPNNSASYIVFRMCDTPGSVEVATAQCATIPAVVANTCQGAINYENEGKCPSGSGTTPYYRIVVRINGPRNTTSITETIVHF